ncbi:EndoU domain-containing protein, partial [Amycolatopsis thermoflava]|uniref:EndoU domain-containing protein n=1 Tax=Amycolatopsis thermoflava TaxID=84480 RepID=UPI003654CB6D
MADFGDAADNFIRELNDWVGFPVAAPIIRMAIDGWLGEYPEAHPDDVQPLVDFWSAKGLDLADLQEQLSTLTEMVTQGYQGAAPAQFAAASTQFSKVILSAAQNAMQMGMGVGQFQTSLALAKNSYEVMLVMTVTEIAVSLAAAVPSLGGSLAGIPGSITATGFAIRALLRKAAAEIAEISIKQAIKKFSIKGAGAAIARGWRIYLAHTAGRIGARELERSLMRIMPQFKNPAIRREIAQQLARGYGGRETLERITQRAVQKGGLTPEMQRRLAEEVATHVARGGAGKVIGQRLFGYGVRSGLMYGAGGSLAGEVLTDIEMGDKYRVNFTNVAAGFIGASLGGGPLALAAGLPAHVILGAAGGVIGQIGSVGFTAGMDKLMNAEGTPHDTNARSARGGQQAGEDPLSWDNLTKAALGGAVGGVQELYAGGTSIKEFNSHFSMNLADRRLLTNFHAGNDFSNFIGQSPGQVPAGVTWSDDGAAPATGHFGGGGTQTATGGATGGSSSGSGGGSSSGAGSAGRGGTPSGAGGSHGSGGSGSGSGAGDASSRNGRTASSDGERRTTPDTEPQRAEIPDGEATPAPEEQRRVATAGGDPATGARDTATQPSRTTTPDPERSTPDTGQAANSGRAEGDSPGTSTPDGATPDAPAHQEGGTTHNPDAPGSQESDARNPDAAGRREGDARDPDATGRREGASQSPDTAGRQEGDTSQNPDGTGRREGASQSPDTAGRQEGDSRNPDATGRQEGDTSQNPDSGTRDGNPDDTGRTTDTREHRQQFTPDTPPEKAERGPETATAVTARTLDALNDAGYTVQVDRETGMFSVISPDNQTAEFFLTLNDDLPAGAMEVRGDEVHVSSLVSESMAEVMQHNQAMMGQVLEHLFARAPLPDEFTPSLVFTHAGTVAGTTTPQPGTRWHALPRTVQAGPDRMPSTPSAQDLTDAITRRQQSTPDNDLGSHRIATALHGTPGEGPLVVQYGNGNRVLVQVLLDDRVPDNHVQVDAGTWQVRPDGSARQTGEATIRIGRGDLDALLEEGLRTVADGVPGRDQPHQAVNHRELSRVPREPVSGSVTVTQDTTADSEAVVREFDSFARGLGRTTAPQAVLTPSAPSLGDAIPLQRLPESGVRLPQRVEFHDDVVRLVYDDVTVDAVLAVDSELAAGEYQVVYPRFTTDGVQAEPLQLRVSDQTLSDGFQRTIAERVKWRHVLGEVGTTLRGLGDLTDGTVALYRDRGIVPLARTVMTTVRGARLVPDPLAPRSEDGGPRHLEVRMPDATSFTQDTGRVMEALAKAGLRPDTTELQWDHAESGVPTRWTNPVTGEQFVLRFGTPDSVAARAHAARLDPDAGQRAEILRGVLEPDLSTIELPSAQRPNAWDLAGVADHEHRPPIADLEVSGDVLDRLVQRHGPEATDPTQIRVARRWFDEGANPRLALGEVVRDVVRRPDVATYDEESELWAVRGERDGLTIAAVVDAEGHTVQAEPLPGPNTEAGRLPAAEAGRVLGQFQAAVAATDGAQVRPATLDDLSGTGPVRYTVDLTGATSRDALLTELADRGFDLTGATGDQVDLRHAETGQAVQVRLHTAAATTGTTTAPDPAPGTTPDPETRPDPIADAVGEVAGAALTEDGDGRYTITIPADDYLVAGLSVADQLDAHGLTLTDVDGAFGRRSAAQLGGRQWHGWHTTWTTADGRTVEIHLTTEEGRQHAAQVAEIARQRDQLRRGDPRRFWLDSQLRRLTDNPPVPADAALTPEVRRTLTSGRLARQVAAELNVPRVTLSRPEGGLPGHLVARTPDGTEVAVVRTHTDLGALRRELAGLSVTLEPAHVGELGGTGAAFAVVPLTEGGTVAEVTAAFADTARPNGWHHPDVAFRTDRPAEDRIRLDQDVLHDHILDGTRGGGHRHGTGVPGKTEFPARWSDDRIEAVIRQTAAHPTAVQWDEDHNSWIVTREHDGVVVAVVVLPDGWIATSYPEEGRGVVTNPRPVTPERHEIAPTLPEAVLAQLENLRHPDRPARLPKFPAEWFEPGRLETILTRIVAEGLQPDALAETPLEPLGRKKQDWVYGEHDGVRVRVAIDRNNVIHRAEPVVESADDQREGRSRDGAALRGGDRAADGGSARPVRGPAGRAGADVGAPDAGRGRVADERAGADPGTAEAGPAGVDAGTGRTGELPGDVRQPGRSGTAEAADGTGEAGPRVADGTAEPRRDGSDRAGENADGDVRAADPGARSRGTDPGGRTGELAGSDAGDGRTAGAARDSGDPGGTPDAAAAAGRDGSDQAGTDGDSRPVARPDARTTVDRLDDATRERILRFADHRLEVVARGLDVTVDEVRRRLQNRIADAFELTDAGLAEAFADDAAAHDRLVWYVGSSGVYDWATGRVGLRPGEPLGIVATALVKEVITSFRTPPHLAAAAFDGPPADLMVQREIDDHVLLREWLRGLGDPLPAELAQARSWSERTLEEVLRYRYESTVDHVDRFTVSIERGEPGVEPSLGRENDPRLTRMADPDVADAVASRLGEPAVTLTRAEGETTGRLPAHFVVRDGDGSDIAVVRVHDNADAARAEREVLGPALPATIVDRPGLPAMTVAPLANDAGDPTRTVAEVIEAFADGARPNGWDAVAGHPDFPPPHELQLNDARAEHILDSDPTGGGHRHGLGKPNKDEFPERWGDDAAVRDIIERIARHPDRVLWEKGPKTWRLTAVRDGVEMVVVILPGHGIGVLTAHPEGGRGVVRNPPPAAPPRSDTPATISDKVLKRLESKHGPNSRAPGVAKFPESWFNEPGGLGRILTESADEAIRAGRIEEVPERAKLDLLRAAYAGAEVDIFVTKQNKIEDASPRPGGPGVVVNPERGGGGGSGAVRGTSGGTDGAAAGTVRGPVGSGGPEGSAPQPGRGGVVPDGAGADRVAEPAGEPGVDTGAGRTGDAAGDVRGRGAGDRPGDAAGSRDGGAVGADRGDQPGGSADRADGEDAAADVRAADPGDGPLGDGGRRGRAGLAGSDAGDSGAAATAPDPGDGGRTPDAVAAAGRDGSAETGAGGDSAALTPESAARVVTALDDVTRRELAAFGKAGAQAIADALRLPVSEVERRIDALAESAFALGGDVNANLPGYAGRVGLRTGEPLAVLATAFVREAIGVLNPVTLTEAVTGLRTSDPSRLTELIHDLVRAREIGDRQVLRAWMSAVDGDGRGLLDGVRRAEENVLTALALTGAGTGHAAAPSLALPSFPAAVVTVADQAGFADSLEGVFARAGAGAERIADGAETTWTITDRGARWQLTVRVDATATEPGVTVPRPRQEGGRWVQDPVRVVLPAVPAGPEWRVQVAEALGVRLLATVPLTVQALAAETGAEVVPAPVVADAGTVPAPQAAAVLEVPGREIRLDLWPVPPGLVTTADPALAADAVTRVLRTLDAREIAFDGTTVSAVLGDFPVAVRVDATATGARVDAPALRLADGGTEHARDGHWTQSRPVEVTLPALPVDPYWRAEVVRTALFGAGAEVGSHFVEATRELGRQLQSELPPVREVAADLPAGDDVEIAGLPSGERTVVVLDGPEMRTRHIRIEPDEDLTSNARTIADTLRGMLASESWAGDIQPDPGGDGTTWLMAARGDGPVLRFRVRVDPDAAGTAKVVLPGLELRADVDAARDAEPGSRLADGRWVQTAPADVVVPPLPSDPAERSRALVELALDLGLYAPAALDRAVSDLRGEWADWEAVTLPRIGNLVTGAPAASPGPDIATADPQASSDAAGWITQEDFTRLLADAVDTIETSWEFAARVGERMLGRTDGILTDDEVHMVREALQRMRNYQRDLEEADFDAGRAVVVRLLHDSVVRVAEWFHRWEPELTAGRPTPPGSSMLEHLRQQRALVAWMDTTGAPLDRRFLNRVFANGVLAQAHLAAALGRQVGPEDPYRWAPVAAELLPAGDDAALFDDGVTLWDLTELVAEVNQAGQGLGLVTRVVAAVEDTLSLPGLPDDARQLLDDVADRARELADSTRGGEVRPVAEALAGLREALTELNQRHGIDVSAPRWSTTAAVQAGDGPLLPGRPPKPRVGEDLMGGGSGAWGSERPTLWGRTQHLLGYGFLVGGYATGKPTAAALFKHFLGNTGEDFVVHTDRMMRDIPGFHADATRQVRHEALRAAQAAEARGETGRFEFTSRWQRFHKYRVKEQNNDWFNAVGTFYYAVSGVVTVSPPSVPGGRPQVSVDYQVHVHDRYNWHYGMMTFFGPKIIPITRANPHTGMTTAWQAPVTIKHSIWQMLHRSGLAQEFDIVGSTGRKTHTGPLSSLYDLEVPLEPGTRGNRLVDGLTGFDRLPSPEAANRLAHQWLYYTAAEDRGEVWIQFAPARAGLVLSTPDGDSELSFDAEQRAYVGDGIRVELVPDTQGVPDAVLITRAGGAPESLAFGGILTPVASETGEHPARVAEERELGEAARQALARFRQNQPTIVPGRDVALSTEWTVTGETTTGAVEATAGDLLADGVAGVTLLGRMADPAGAGTLFQVRLADGTETVLRVRADEAFRRAWLHVAPLRIQGGNVRQTAAIELVVPAVPADAQAREQALELALRQAADVLPGTVRSMTTSFLAPDAALGRLVPDGITDEDAAAVRQWRMAEALLDSERGLPRPRDIAGAPLPARLREGAVENPDGTETRVVYRSRAHQQPPLFHTTTTAPEAAREAGGIGTLGESGPGADVVRAHQDGSGEQGTLSFEDLRAAAGRMRDHSGTVYVYEHHTPGGADIDASGLRGAGTAGVLQTGIAWQDVTGWWSHEVGPDGRVVDSAWHDNPDFRPRRAPAEVIVDRIDDTTRADLAEWALPFADVVAAELGVSPDLVRQRIEEKARTAFELSRRGLAEAFPGDEAARDRLSPYRSVSAVYDWATGRTGVRPGQPLAVAGTGLLKEVITSFSDDPAVAAAAASDGDFAKLMLDREHRDHRILLAAVRTFEGPLPGELEEVRGWTPELLDEVLGWRYQSTVDHVDRFTTALRTGQPVVEPSLGRDDPDEVWLLNMVGGDIPVRDGGPVHVAAEVGPDGVMVTIHRYYANGQSDTAVVVPSASPEQVAEQVRLIEQRFGTELPPRFAAASPVVEAEHVADVLRWYGVPDEAVTVTQERDGVTVTFHGEPERTVRIETGPHAQVRRLGDLGDGVDRISISAATDQATRDRQVTAALGRYADQAPPPPATAEPPATPPSTPPSTTDSGASPTAPETPSRPATPEAAPEAPAPEADASAPEALAPQTPTQAPV